MHCNTHNMAHWAVQCTTRSHPAQALPHAACRTELYTVYIAQWFAYGFAVQTKLCVRLSGLCFDAQKLRRRQLLRCLLLVLQTYFNQRLYVLEVYMSQEYLFEDMNTVRVGFKKIIKLMKQSYQRVGRLPYVPPTKTRFKFIQIRNNEYQTVYLILCRLDTDANCT